MTKTKSRTPGIPRGNQDRALEALIQIVEKREGRRGDSLDAFVSFRDLYEAGTLIRKSSGLSPPGTSDDLIDSGADACDGVIPPQITGLSASAGIGVIILNWNDPAFEYSCHSYTEVWRNDNDSLDSASLAGTASSPGWTDTIGDSATRYYWVRAVSVTGLKGPYSSRIKGETGEDPAYILDMLYGKITSSQLSMDLNDQIEMIGLLNTWQPETYYTEGMVVRPTNTTVYTVEFYYEVQSAGYSSLSEEDEPDWPTTLEETVTDGDQVTWQAITKTGDPRDAWQSQTKYTTGTIVGSTSSTSYDYEAQSTGYSGATEPTWPGSLDGTVDDGDLITFKAIQASGTVVASIRQLETLDMDADTPYAELLTQLGMAKVNTWSASTVYSENDVVQDTAGTSGYYFQATGGGTSGSTEPTWPDSEGETVTDGGVTWEAVSSEALSAAGDGSPISSVVLEQRMTVVDGVSGEYYVKIDSGGSVAGFGLYSDESGYSEFIVNANFFAVTNPSVDGEYSEHPFIIDQDPDSGETYIALSGQVVINGTLAVEKLEGGILGEDVSIVCGDNAVILSGAGTITVGEPGWDRGEKNYCLLTDGDITFYRYIGGAMRDYKSLKRREMGTCVSGQSTTLPGYWRDAPDILVSPRDITFYDARYSNQDQKIICKVEKTFSLGSNQYGFEAKVELQLAEGSAYEALDNYLSGFGTGTHSGTTNSYTTPDNTEEISLTGTYSLRAAFISPDPIGGDDCRYILYGAECSLTVQAKVDGALKEEVTYSYETEDDPRALISDGSWSMSVTNLSSASHTVTVEIFVNIGGESYQRWDFGRGEIECSGSFDAGFEFEWRTVSTALGEATMIAEGTMNYLAVGD